LKSVEETDAEWKNAVEGFTGGDAAEAGILSLTFARQKQDLSESQISGFVKLLKHLEEIKLVSDGAGTISIVHMCFTCCYTASVQCFNTHCIFGLGLHFSCTERCYMGCAVHAAIPTECMLRFMQGLLHYFCIASAAAIIPC
jgi:hypothetical protein